jgi:hypothetical protein
VILKAIKINALNKHEWETLKQTWTRFIMSL